MKRGFNGSRSKQDKQRRTVKTIAAKAGGKARTKKPKMLETTEMVEGQCADMQPT